MVSFVICIATIAGGAAPVARSGIATAPPHRVEVAARAAIVHPVRLRGDVPDFDAPPPQVQRGERPCRAPEPGNCRLIVFDLP